ncbi:hypothetical protein DXG01_004859, partial [Tephrocybe rancida]
PNLNPMCNGTLGRNPHISLPKGSKKDPAPAPTLHIKANRDSPQEHREVSGGDPTREQNLTGEKPQMGGTLVGDHQMEGEDTPMGEGDHQMTEGDHQMTEGDPQMVEEEGNHLGGGPQEVTQMEEDPQMGEEEVHQEDGCQEDPQADRRTEEEGPWEAGAPLNRNGGNGHQQAPQQNNNCECLNHKSKIDIRKPEGFMGQDPQKWKPFITECLMTFHTKSTTYSMDHLRMAFASLYLKDTALQHFTTILTYQPDHVLFQSWREFLYEFGLKFGIPNIQGEAKNSLMRMMMRKHEKFTSYRI